MRQLWAICTRLSIFVPSPIDRGAVRAAVDRRARADLHVAADPHVAELRGRHVPAADLRIAEAVGADHRAAVNDRAVADDRVFVQHGARADRHVAADDAAGQQVGAGQNRRAVADLAIVADRRARVNVDAFAPPRRCG